MVQLLQSLFLSVRSAAALILLVGVAACDTPIGTERPLAFGAPVTEAQAAALLGDFTADIEGRAATFSITWRTESVAENITDRGSLRVQMRVDEALTLQFDTTLVLSALPGEEGLYAASVVPDWSLLYETKGERAGDFVRVKFPFMFLLKTTGNSVHVWMINDTGSRETRLIDVPPQSEKRWMHEEMEHGAFVLSPRHMRQALLVNNARVRRGSMPFIATRKPTEQACKANWIDWSNAAADKPGASARLADWYADSITKCPQNCGEAVGYLASESLTGSASAKQRLARWRSSNVCEINTGNNPFLRDYLKRAKAGDVKAMYSLARMYELDTGIVPTDYEHSIKWYLAAAEAGDREAQFTAGKMYHYGVGAPGPSSLVRRDAATARFWYDKAASAGHAGAAAARRELNTRPAARDRRAEDLLAAAGAIAVTYCVLNPEDCFGSGSKSLPVEATTGGASGDTCAARVASGLMLCQSHIDFSSCGPGGCSDYWECNRVSRYLKNGQPKYATKRTDVRTYGACRRPGSSGRTDDKLFCDPETGKQARSYEGMVAKACQ